MSDELNRAAPIAAQLDQTTERAEFEAWARAGNIQLTMDVNGEGYHYPLAKAGWSAWQAARRTEPVAAQLDTNALPPLPEPEEVDNVRWAYTADSMNNYAIDAVAPYTERIRHLERELAATKLAPMCERKTDDIMQREGYEKTGYVLKKVGERVCVSDGGAVAWFTTDEWNWLMFNRDHVEFNWPKPLAYIDGRTAGTAPDGYVLAPAEATEAMVHAAQDLPPPRLFGVVYRTMIAAAPSPLPPKEETK